ncbi:SUF system NifU family Fe-S cluster assembly protein [Streptomyces alkaliphilus]|uniref:SUF system NifU family Fe-S cluster assembly protein n=1 Tax=Streptomyces alkaliphilus TaxID=1472722 RepID=A0A7W3Y0I6_9ACTN|nr:SUF system NifU family Fe-S cluster assembly protein [Streptomyces alkaliphilus]
MKLESMYQDVILDHYKNPRGRGLREGDAEVHHVNPTCGDEITLRVRLDGDTIADVSYEGQGCSISQAGASVLNELLVGAKIADARRIQESFLELMQSKGRLEPDDEMEEILQDAVAFAGVSKYPARVKCALLSWMAWKDATAQAAGGEEATAQAAGGEEATAQAAGGEEATAQAAGGEEATARVGAVNHHNREIS